MASAPPRLTFLPVATVTKPPFRSPAAPTEAAPPTDENDSTPRATRYRTPHGKPASLDSNESSMTTPRRIRPCGIYHPSPTKKVSLPHLLVYPNEGLKKQVMSGTMVTAPLAFRIPEVSKTAHIFLPTDRTGESGYMLASHDRTAAVSGTTALLLLSERADSTASSSTASASSHGHSILHQRYLIPSISPVHSGIDAALTEKFLSLQGEMVPLPDAGETEFPSVIGTASMDSAERSVVSEAGSVGSVKLWDTLPEWSCE